MSEPAKAKTSIFGEFREFIARGNVIDLAVGVIIGAAFNDIVKGLVDNVVMPPIGLLLSGVDFSQMKLVLKAADPANPVRPVLQYRDQVRDRRLGGVPDRQRGQRDPAQGRRDAARGSAGADAAGTAADRDPRPP